MAAIELNTAEVDTLNKANNLTDGTFEFALREGVNEPGPALLVAPMTGYSGFADDLKQVIKGSWLSLMSAMMKGSPWVAAAFQGLWTQWADTNYDTVSYRKDGMNTVWLKGLARSNANGVGTAIFILPVGFRPLKHRLFASVANAVFCSIQVSSNGQVIVQGGPTIDTYFSLDGISFPAEQ